MKNHLPGDSSHEKFTFSLTIPKFGHVKRGSARLMKEFLKRSGVSDYHGVCLTWRSLEKFVRSEIAHLGKLTPEDVDSCCPKIR